MNKHIERRQKHFRMKMVTFDFQCQLISIANSFLVSYSHQECLLSHELPSTQTGKEKEKIYYFHWEWLKTLETTNFLKIVGWQKNQGIVVNLYALYEFPGCSSYRISYDNQNQAIVEVIITFCTGVKRHQPTAMHKMQNLDILIHQTFHHFWKVYTPYIDAPIPSKYYIYIR